MEKYKKIKSALRKTICTFLCCSLIITTFSVRKVEAQQSKVVTVETGDNYIIKDNGDGTSTIEMLLEESKSHKEPQISIPDSINEEYPIVVEDEGFSFSFYNVETKEGILYQYIEESWGLKEEIILEGRPESNVFQAVVSVKGATIEPSGEILLLDDKENIKGYMPAPNLEDSSGVVDIDSVKYQLEKTDDNKFVISIVVDESYLENAEYPVIIDPTLVLKNNDKFTDVYVRSDRWANTNFYSSGVPIMLIGMSNNDGNYGLCRTYIRFPELQQLIEGKVITSATLTLSENCSYLNGVSVEARMVTQPWNPANITWNNQPEYSSAVLDSSRCRNINNYQHSLDITAAVSQWALNEMDNYGIVLKAQSENYSKRTETSFFGSRRSDNRKPYLTVTYQNTPTIENIHQGSPQTNSGVGNIIVDFNPVNGISRYKIRVSSSSGRFVEKEITASIVQSGTYYRFKSENVSLFYGYDGLPVDSTTVLGEGDGKYYISVGAVNKSGHTVYGEAVQLQLSDTVAPDDVNSVIELQQSRNNTGNNLTVVFDGVMDQPENNSSGIDYYKIKLYREGVYVSGSEARIENTGGRITYTYEEIEDAGEHSVSVRSFDRNGNYSSEVFSNTIMLNDYKAPEEGNIIVPEYFSNDGLNIKWEGFRDNLDPLPEIYYRIDNAEGQQLSGRTHLSDGSSGSSVIGTSSFTADGEIFVYLSARDAAGNMSDEMQASSIRDTVSPTVEILNEQNTFSDYLTIRFEGEDDNIIARYSIEYKQDNAIDEYHTVKDAETNDQSVYCEEAFRSDKISLSNNEYYIFLVTVWDGAGNSESATIRMKYVKDSSIRVPDFTIEHDDFWMVNGEPEEIVFAGCVPEGTVRLYVDGTEMDDSEYIDMSEIADVKDGSRHYVYATVENDEGRFYSVPVITSVGELFYRRGGTAIMMEPADVIRPYITRTFHYETAGLLTKIKLMASASSIDFDYYVSINGSDYTQIELNTEYDAEDFIEEADEKSSRIEILVGAEVENLKTDPFVHLDQLVIVATSLDIGENDFFTYYAVPIPENLTIEENSSYQNIVRWSYDSDQATFDVFRAEYGSTNYELISEAQQEKYCYDSPAESKRYTYRVTANINGEQSMWTEMSTSEQINGFSNDILLGIEEKFDYYQTGNSYINLSNGNLVIEKEDDVFYSGSLALVNRRTYNSLSSTSTAFGYGWDFNFNILLLSYENHHVLKEGDGSIHRFEQNTEGAYISEDKEYILENGNEYVSVRRKDKTEYRFIDGRLEAILTTDGQRISLGYDDYGRLISVESGENIISYHYNDISRIDYLTMPDERRISYQYDERGRLISASETNSTLNRATGLIEENVLIVTQYEYNNEGKISTITVPLGNGSLMENLYYDCEGRITGIDNGGEEGVEISYTGIDGVRTTTIEKYYANNLLYQGIYRFNNDGYAVSVDDGGLRTQIERDGSGNILSTVSYVSFNREDGTSYEQPIEYRYRYNENNDMTQMVDPYGHITEYVYGDTNNPYSVTEKIYERDEENTVAEYYSYDSITGRQLSSTDGEGRTSSFLYDNLKPYLLVKATDEYGTETVYIYDEKDRLTETRVYLSEDNYISQRVLSYNTRNLPLAVADGNGNITEYTYDSKGNVLKVTNPDQSTRYNQYYPDGSIKRSENEKGDYVLYYYDELGRQIRSTINQNDNSVVHQSSIDYQYVSEDGKTLLKVTAEESENGVSEIASIRYYDGKGNLVRETAEGVTVNCLYDEYGNISSIEYEDGRRIIYCYDRLSRPVAISIISDDNDIITTHSSYDYVGNLTEETDAEGNSRYFSYDNIGRIVQLNENEIATQYLYDQTDGNIITNKTISPSGLITETVLDRASRTVKQVQIADQEQIKTEYEYDGNGNCTREIRNDGSETQYVYNSRNLLISKVTTDGYSSSYSYDETGRMLSATSYDSEGLVTEKSYVFDALSRAVQYVQDGEAVYYQFTPSSKVKSIIYRNGQYDRKISYSYNSNTLLSGITVSNLDTDSHNEIESFIAAQYFYDDYGRVNERTVINDESVMTARYQYNDFGQKEKIEYFVGNNVVESYQYQYNRNNHIVSVRQYNSYQGIDNTVNYEYDNLSRLTHVSVLSAEDTSITDYHYDASSNRTSMIRDGVRTDYEYNLFNQLIRTAEETEAGEEVGEIVTVYQYDGNGNLVREVEERPLESFYSEMQLYPEVTIKGNLNQRSERNYHYNSEGMMLASDSVQTISGSVVSTVSNGHETPLPHPETIEPTVFRTNNGSYSYDGNGQRVRKTVVYNNGTANQIEVERKYYYTGSEVLYVSDSSHNKSIENIMSPSGEILLSERYQINDSGAFENGCYIYNTDLQGSVTSILKADGTLANGYVYDEYGNIEVTATEDFINENTYTGAIYDNETSLYYMNARYYQSTTGQFTSRDSYYGKVGNSATQNLYSYTGANPVNYTDPTGHIAVSVLEDRDTEGYHRSKYDASQYETVTHRDEGLTTTQKFMIGGAIIIGLGILTFLTGGTALACIVKGAFVGAIKGGIAGALGAGLTQAAASVITTGTLDGAAEAFVEGAANGFLSGAIGGAIAGGINSPYCFIAGTLVFTVLGLLPIEEIEAGMQVYSTEKNTGETEIKEVVQTFVNQTYELVHVKLEDGEEIICTPSHPFYTDKGWIDAGKLTEDSLLVDEEGNYIGISSLVTEYLEEPVKVYNFEVEDYHTYYVGDSIILVHNKCVNKDFSNKHAAMREAKRTLNIPYSTLPDKIEYVKMIGNNGRTVSSKMYIFGDKFIRDDFMGHLFKDGSTIARHLNIGTIDKFGEIIQMGLHFWY